MAEKLDWASTYTDNGKTRRLGTAARTLAEENITVNATFIQIFTLTYTTSAGGAIIGTSPQTVKFGGSGTIVTASPNVGYHFMNWSDGVITAARTDTNVATNINVTAYFAPNTTTTIANVK